VHVEFFDTVENIAEEKSVALRKLPADGVAFLDRDGDFFELLEAAASCEVRTVSITGDADYCFISRDIEKRIIIVREKTSGNEITLPMPLPGDFNVLNVLYAVGVARWMGVAWDIIIQALQNYRAMPMRWNKVIIHDWVFINDAYNANPVSMRAAIETFYKEHKAEKKWLILGGMLELGDCENEEHTALGKFIADLSWDGLIVIGKLGKLIADSAEYSGMNSDTIWCCDDCTVAADLVRKYILKDSVVLLKGSRGYKLEQVIDKLLA
jgi:UDP-N-acetylmuramoyl-tripeptide--D-alanyl-D-alanine ligase